MWCLPTGATGICNGAYQIARQRRVSISGIYPAPHRLSPSLEGQRGRIGGFPEPEQERIDDSNFLNPPPKSPTRHTSALRPRQSAEITASPQVKDAVSTAYPPTNGSAGGKLPRGKRALRFPARSFSAASR